MKETKNVQFSYPLYKIKLRVELSAIGKLDSFSQFFLELLSNVSLKREHILDEMEVIHKDFVRHSLDELILNGKLVVEDNNRLSTSEIGQTALIENRIEQSHTCDINLFYDPILRFFLRADDSQIIQNIERIELLDRPKNDEIKNKVDASTLKGFVDTTDFNSDYDVEEVLAVKGFSLLEAPRLCNIPFTLSCILDNENDDIRISCYNKGNDLSKELSYLLYLEDSDRYRIPEGLKLEFLQISQMQAKFFEDLLNKEEMESVPSEIKIIVRDSITPQTSYKVINNIEHAKFLKDMIRLAKKSIYIASGWLNWAFANDNMMRLISKRLKEGVEFHIYYTINKSSNLSAIDKMEDYARQFKGLKLVLQPTTWHRKAIIVDDEICVIGSFNWLSNKGEESIETSLMLKDKRIAKELKNAVFFDSNTETFSKVS